MREWRDCIVMSVNATSCASCNAAPVYDSGELEALRRDVDTREVDCRDDEVCKSRDV